MVFIITLLAFSTLAGIPLKSRAFDCVKDLTDRSAPDQKQQCQNELDMLLGQLKDLQKQLDAQAKQTGNIAGDIKYLTSQVNALNTKIKARTLAIANLKVSINQKTAKIETLQQKIDKEKESLAQLLRNTNEFDNQDLLNLVLSDDAISQFYSDVESYASINQAIKRSVDEILGIRNETETEKANLQKQQLAENNAKIELQNAQKQVTATQNAKKELLAVSKQKEANYKATIAAQQKRVANIKARLFSLAGGSAAIRFDVALGYAEAASRQTGVDPAFLLAVLTQESNLGSNVGKCYLTDSSTGAGVSITSGRVWSNLMHPTRDVPVFLAITAGLGFNAFKTVVSCPIAGVKGYGGAMGPAQFIPSTWKLFDKRITAITGSSPTNPWSATDAFTASALYLGDLGAVGTSTTAQKRAACRYYGSGGSSCTYSRSVMSLMSKIQADIDYLRTYGVTKN